MSHHRTRAHDGPAVRVLFVDHAHALGGAEHSLLLLLRCLNRARVVPVLACVPGPLRDRALAVGVPCHILPLDRVRGRPLGLLALGRGGWELARLARGVSADLICANTVRSSLYAALASVLSRVPMVWYVRDILTRGLYTRVVAQLASAVVAVSRAAASPLPCEATVVPNGLLPDEFLVGADVVAERRRQWGIPAEAPVVGMAGRLRAWKGQADFVRAMRVVADAMPKAKFLIVGGTVFEEGTPYLPTLERLVTSLGLDGKVVFAGHQTDMRGVYGAMDVVIHCSVKPEPFGRVIIEAMAAGRPVVAYAAGGPQEIVVDGETGILVPPGDHEALGRAALMLLADAERRDTMGEAARARVAAHYDARETARRVEAILLRTARAKAVKA
jgi:glycosyltransferase involved in cell wall biosynthesis